MFETMTYENILSDLLNRVVGDVDKREGSIIYDALAPCAYQLAQVYFNLNNFIDLVSGDTAVGEYLDRVVADYGISRKAATKAVRKIETNKEIEIGSRWGLKGTTYVITESIAANLYKAECEQFGEVGNQYSGVLDNLDNVSGITATLSDILDSGDEEETDENLRERFYSQVRSPSTSGNADNYKKWALEVPGVGDAKVYPLWNGNGTVKLIIVDSNMAIDTSLVKPVYNYIESVRPIGATVTVTSPDSKAINISASITLDGTKRLDQVVSTFTAAFTEYLKGTIFEAYVISYARLGSILLATEGISDYSNLLINEGTDNVIIGDTELPIVGNIQLMEVVSD